MKSTNVFHLGPCSICFCCFKKRKGHLRLQRKAAFHKMNLELDGWKNEQLQTADFCHRCHRDADGCVWFPQTTSGVCAVINCTKELSLHCTNNQNISLHILKQNIEYEKEMLSWIVLYANDITAVRFCGNDRQPKSLRDHSAFIMPTQLKQVASSVHESICLFVD